MIFCPQMSRWMGQRSRTHKDNGKESSEAFNLCIPWCGVEEYGFTGAIGSNGRAMLEPGQKRRDWWDGGGPP